MIKNKLALYDKEISSNIDMDFLYKFIDNTGMCYYVNIHTGQIADNIPDISKNKRRHIIENYGDKYFLSFWKATEDKEAVCLVVLNIDLTNIKNGIKREFKEIDRFYFLKDKTIFRNGEKIEPEELDELPYDLMIIDLLDLDTRKVDAYYSACEKELVKVFPPIVNLKNIGICSISDPDAFFAFLKEKTIKNENNQRPIDAFVNKTPDINFYDLLKDIYFEEYKMDFSYIQKIEDGFVVVRIFAAGYKENYESFYKNEKELKVDDYYILEYIRYYIKGQKVYLCFRDANSEWIYDNVRNHGKKIFLPEDKNDLLKKIDKIFLLSFNEDILNNTILEYAKDVLRLYKDFRKHKALAFFLRYPLLTEYLEKYGLNVILAKSLSDSFSDPMSSISYCINLNKEEDTFNGLLGLSWNQIKILADHYDYYQYTTEECRVSCNDISIIKNIFGCSNISFVDNTSFDFICLFVVRNIFYMPIHIYSALRYIYATYGLKALLKVIGLFEKYEEEDINMGRMCARVINIYCDYIDLLKKINEPHLYKYTFDSPEELLQNHDMLVSLYNAQKDEFQKEAFDAAIKRVVSFMYSDKNYTVIVPSVPSDIAYEGKELAHCVKLYIDRIIEGKTNIMFIRKTDNINKPFFTVEISNEGVIEQIHGYQNRNISSEPDMLYFIDDWIKHCNLKMNNCNKVR